MSDVSCDICVEPDLLPVVMSTDAVEPLAVPVVALTRSQVDVISRAAVYLDLLSGRVMKSVDPDVRNGDPMSLKMIPGADGDSCHSEWREMVLDDVMMEKFVLVPEVCPVGSMTSAAEPTFLPALSEVYSPVFFSRGGGGGNCCGKPPGGGGVRYSASVWPTAGVRYSASVSCRNRSNVDLGVTPDGGPMEGAPVLEPLEHSVLGETPDCGPMVGAPVLEPNRAFASGKGPGRSTYGGYCSSGPAGAFSA